MASPFALIAAKCSASPLSKARDRSTRWAGDELPLGDVETMVLSAKQRTLYELTDAISARDRVRALALLQGLLNSSDAGEDAAIGHLYMLARTFRETL